MPGFFDHQLTAALDRLADLDPDMAAARSRFGDPPDRMIEPGYSALARIILGQQISRAVAETLWQRLQAASWTGAAALSARQPDELLELGLSRRKAEYLIDLAKACQSGQLNLTQLGQMAGIEVQARLTQIRGIGNWTADNYRLFALADFDAWPGNDLALQEGMRLLKQLNSRPKADQMDRMAERWRPVRGAGALMLWHIYAAKKRQGAPVRTLA
ncbi:MAG: DNA-3-methyladenine glycosylase 2 family protein [Alphaproteobacteria bacterium]|jgi:DNA-3-methyladenine glycosylase II|nr:DNA-3-methyladenine glycosylase 2 family protein [Alphaproteobacteria bacterium]